MEKEIVQRYIQLIKQKVEPYYVDEQFWKAVLQICLNNKEDALLLLKNCTNEIQYRIDLSKNEKIYVGVNHFLDYGASTIEELAYKIADDIIEWHNMTLDDIKIKLFEQNIMQKKNKDMALITYYTGLSKW